MSAPPHLKNILIVGAGGQIGSQIVTALVAEGKHTITALTRPDSTSSIPSSVHAVRKANYSDASALAAAMTGQDVLIITMGVTAPPSASTALIDAAAAAGIQYIVPNEWGTDRAQVQLGKDLMLAEGQIKLTEYIESKGLKWISIACGFWYEFSLAGGTDRFGFDLTKKELTLYDGGNTRITTTTWPKTAKALAKVLGLAAEGVARFENGQVMVESFLISQREMFDSVLRATGGKEAEWTVKEERAKERFARGTGLLGKGDFSGFTIAMYSRAFFEDDSLDHHVKAKKVDELLGLEVEDLDQATKVAIEMARDGLGKY